MRFLLHLVLFIEKLSCIWSITTILFTCFHYLTLSFNFLKFWFRGFSRLIFKLFKHFLSFMNLLLNLFCHFLCPSLAWTFLFFTICVHLFNFCLDIYFLRCQYGIIWLCEWNMHTILVFIINLFPYYLLWLFSIWFKILKFQILYRMIFVTVLVLKHSLRHWCIHLSFKISILYSLKHFNIPVCL